MRLRFENCDIDGDTRELKVAGRPVDVEPRAFDLLMYLLEHRDRVVGKDELLDAIWPRQIVTETALARCVMKARKAIGDSSGRHGGKHGAIRTVHGHGYRFVGAVTAAGDGAHSDAPPVPAPQDRPLPPVTRYARSGDLSIAYQVIGTGPVDIVLVNGWISNVELAWEHPRPRRFLERLASFARLINFDKRGTGLSDRSAGLPTFEQRMDDVRAVMDAAGSERAVLMGYSEGGPMCVLFAATYPERTAGLVLYGTYMKRVRSMDYPWAPTRDERLAAIEAVDKNWDQGLDVEHYAPSMAGDAAFANWLMAYWRRSASPKTAGEILRMNTDIDMCHVLPSVRVPTLVMHRVHDRDSKAAEGRYIASRIPGAEFLELPGADHLVWAGDMEDILVPVEAFVARVGTAAPAESVLMTLLAVTPADPGAPDAGLDREFGACLDACQGRPVLAEQGLLGAFDGTGRALRAAFAMRDWAVRSGRGLHIALHVGECVHTGTGVSGAPVAAVQAIAGAAPDNAVLVSRIVRDLVTGYSFDDAGSVQVTRRPLQVYRAERL
ncbi:MAG TPA: alpha/beta fold hydrolase [Woeseiaceae bacterium]|nr:alpha/beta fold hydrolase [Woeseiaceae bacterium]